MMPEGGGHLYPVSNAFLEAVKANKYGNEPALDVGDILSFTGGQADATKIACITSNAIKIFVEELES